MKFKHLIFASVFFFALSLNFSSEVFAQTQVQKLDLTVSPQYFDFNIDPGNEIKDKIKIRNNSQNSIMLNIDIEKMTAYGNEGNAIMQKPGAEDEFVNWVQLNTNSFTINPKEQVELPFTIKVPKEAAFGYYFAFVMNQAVSVEPGQPRITKLVGGIAVPALLNVNKPGAVMKGEIVGFKTDSYSYEYPPVNFALTFSNKGNIHIKPRGNIFIKDWLGKEVAIVEVNQSLGNILPNSQRTFESSWNDGFITFEDKIKDGKVVLDAKGKPQKNLKFRFDKILDLRIGQYKASAILVLSDSKKDIPFEASATFFIFPWKIVAGLVIFVLLALIGVVNTFKSIKKRFLSIFQTSKK